MERLLNYIYIYIIYVDICIIYVEMMLYENNHDQHARCKIAAKNRETLSYFYTKVEEFLSVLVSNQTYNF